MNYVSWFCILYFIGSFIRLYDCKLFRNCRFWGGMTGVVFVGAACSTVVMAYLANRVGNVNYIFYFTADSNKFIAVALGVSSFLFFKNLNIKNSRVINTIAASTFGVLLIHANGDAMRRWLWKDVLHNVEMYDSPKLVLHVFGSIIGVFVVCTIIDYFRIKFIEKPVFHWMERRGAFDE